MSGSELQRDELRRRLGYNDGQRKYFHTWNLLYESDAVSNVMKCHEYGIRHDECSESQMLVLTCQGS